MECIDFLGPISDQQDGATVQNGRIYIPGIGYAAAIVQCVPGIGEDMGFFKLVKQRVGKRNRRQRPCLGNWRPDTAEHIVTQDIAHVFLNVCHRAYSSV